MSVNVKENLVSPGLPLCESCMMELIVRMAVEACGEDTILFGGPCCCVMQEKTGVQYYGTMMTNMASSASGVSRALRRKGKDTTCLCIAGDGTTADIAFGVVSAAAERGERILYICYDNEAYMNTGVQKSSLTPYGMKTTNTPSGQRIHGSQTSKKRMFEIVAAHGIPYAATASVGYPEDYLAKVEKAKNTDGTSYIHVMAPCPTGWGTASDVTVDLGKEAVDCGLWYLAEYENGEFKLNRNPKEFTPIESYLKQQSRFANLDEKDLARITAERDASWERMRRDWVK